MMLSDITAIIENTASTIGLDPDLVFRVPLKQSIILPKPRLEIELLDQTIKRRGRRFARLPGSNPATHVKHRWRIYDITVKIRCEIRSEDEDWTESFYQDFLTALPKKAADSNNDLIEISHSIIKRRGYENRLVETFIVRDLAFMLDFKGGIHKDSETPYILDVNIVDGISIQFENY